MNYELITITNQENNFEIEARCVGIREDDEDGGYQAIYNADDAQGMTEIVWGVYYRELPDGPFEHVKDCPDRDAAHAETRKLEQFVKNLLAKIAKAEALGHKEVSK